MYLCICNAVSEERVIEAIESGCGSFNEVSKATGLCAECGQCAFKARKSASDYSASTGNTQKNRTRFQPLDLQTVLAHYI